MPDVGGVSVETQSLRGRRMLTAFILGGFGCVAIWVATPFFYYIVGVENVTDSYLPAAPVFLLLLLVLGLNPLLRAFRRGWDLSPGQLVLILGMMLVACVLPIQGYLFELPYSLANACVRINADAELAAAYAESGLPQALFPDALGHGLPTATSDALLRELIPGQAMPWLAWLGPLLSWGAFLLCYALIMMGLAMIVLPQR